MVDVSWISLSLLVRLIIGRIPFLYLAEITSGWLLGDFRVSIVWVFLVSIGWYYEWLTIGRFPCLYWLTLRLVDHWEISVSLLVEFSVSLFVEFSVSLLADYEWFSIGIFPCLCWHYEVYYWEISVPQLFEFSLSLLVDITSGWSLEVFHVSIVWVFHLSIGWHYEQWPIGRFPCLYWLTLRVVAHWEISMSLLVDITSGWPLKVFRVSIVWVFHVSIDWHYEWLTTADLRRPKLLFCVSFAWSFLTSWLFHFCVICTRPKSLYS